MNTLIDTFKDCAHQTGEICGHTMSKLLRRFQLEDFLENRLQEDDDAATIAVKALAYFCDEPHSRRDEFEWAVLTVGVFLEDPQGQIPRKHVPEQALRDLVALLNKRAPEKQIRRWIASYFE